MFEEIKTLFGIGKPVDFATLVKQGAVILDVRSKGEYANGHIKGSLNISVETLQNNLAKIKDKNKPIITCCASGMRSASAKSYLKSNGYIEVYNGGSWQSLQKKLR